MFFTLTFSPLKINLTHIFGDEFYEFAYNSCTILRLMLTFSPYLFSRFRRYLLRSVPSSICLLDTKSSKKSNVTTDVCQFSRRKVGGYDCQAKYCIKRFKNVESGSTNGLILVEKAASVHNHAIKDTSEEREPPLDKIGRLYHYGVHQGLHVVQNDQGKVSPERLAWS